MRKILLTCMCVLSLAGCQQRPDARITTENPPIVAPKQAVNARTEPIFYNGKTYQFTLLPGAGGAYDLAVNGMTAKQEKDAVAVGTSSLRYFACKDGQDTKLTSRPVFADGRWRMQARCS